LIVSILDTSLDWSCSTRVSFIRNGK